MVRKLLRLLQNPAVQKLVAWLAPLVIAWILSRLDKKAEKQSRSRKKK